MSKANNKHWPDDIAGGHPLSAADFPASLKLRRACRIRRAGIWRCKSRYNKELQHKPARSRRGRSLVGRANKCLMTKV